MAFGTSQLDKFFREINEAAERGRSRGFSGQYWNWDHIVSSSLSQALRDPETVPTEYDENAIRVRTARQRFHHLDEFDQKLIIDRATKQIVQQLKEKGIDNAGEILNGYFNDILMIAFNIDNLTDANLEKVGRIPPPPPVAQPQTIDAQDASRSSWNVENEARIHEAFGDIPDTACCSKCGKSLCDKLTCKGPTCNECSLRLAYGWPPGVHLKEGDEKKTCQVPDEQGE